MSINLSLHESISYAQVEAQIALLNKMIAKCYADKMDNLIPGLERELERLVAVNKFLCEHLAMHGVYIEDKAEPKKDVPAQPRGVPRELKPGKGGILSDIKRNRVMLALGALGLGYAIWSKYMKTSEEDKK